jgi:hypothetical protein
VSHRPVWAVNMTLGEEGLGREGGREGGSGLALRLGTGVMVVGVDGTGRDGTGRDGGRVRRGVCRHTGAESLLTTRSGWGWRFIPRALEVADYGHALGRTLRGTGDATA